MYKFALAVCAGALSMLTHASSPVATKKLAEPCPQVCVERERNSVVNTAGVNLRRLRFVGTHLTRPSIASIRLMVGERDGKLGEPLRLIVKADRGLRGRRAEHQVEARIAALQQAFREAGLSLDQLQVSRTR